MLTQLSMFNPSHHQGKALIFITHKMHFEVLLQGYLQTQLPQGNLYFRGC